MCIQYGFCMLCDSATVTNEMRTNFFNFEGRKPHNISDQKLVEQSVLIIFLISAHNFFTIIWKYPHTYIRPYPLCLCKQDINKNEISTNLPIMPSIRIVNSIANTNKQLWTTNLLKISVKMWSIKIVLSSVC